MRLGRTNIKKHLEKLICTHTLWKIQFKMQPWKSLAAFSTHNFGMQMRVYALGDITRDVDL